MTDTVTRKLQIRGLVQGVGYRNYLAYKAGVLGIRGWVRNRSDGSVEAVVQGSAEGVAEIIACAGRGPRAARVDAVDSVESAGEFSGFSVRNTE
ncbi:MAG: acylphosphatase [Burkholderiales bacterium]|jgi:acylphosphatase|nr:acylphosphatase [Burkholderiales bacterium]